LLYREREPTAPMGRRGRFLFTKGYFTFADSYLKLVDPGHWSETAGKVSIKNQH
jgi:hypothetical protein